jgi:hypothetical protein
LEARREVRDARALRLLELVRHQLEACGPEELRHRADLVD